MADKSVKAAEWHSEAMASIAHEYANQRITIMEAAEQQAVEIKRFREELSEIEKTIYKESRDQMEKDLESKVVRE